jgi:hypothetical protein
MKKKEKLKKILNEKISGLQKLSYKELCKLIDNPKTETNGEGKEFYQVEIESFWDDGKGISKNLRVTASIDNGGIRAFFPLTDSFIIMPDDKIL